MESAIKHRKQQPSKALEIGSSIIRLRGESEWDTPSGKGRGKPDGSFPVTDAKDNLL
jgi:hypothetical protein|tara:strand:+ start:10527 stop:10697 length:171 start_codon:yes stop_codon:yes gene_type:complete